ncbi:MAG: heme o synthase [Pirellulaceae bacterium]
MTVVRSRSRLGGMVADYLELTKPKIALLLLASVAVVAFFASGGQPDMFRLLNVIVGTALVAASSCVWNQWLEVGLDSRMERTRERPLPAQRISRQSAAMFGTLLGSVGISYLLATIGWLAALIGAVTWLLYVCVYTPLKRVSPWNTAVGAVAGALPILMGWCAAGVAFDLRAVALFAILFFWQFPHFMAIAWLYREDYAQAGMRMWPVVEKTGARAGTEAVSCALALLLVSLIPGVAGLSSPHLPYLFGALILGIGMLLASIRFCYARNRGTARQLLFASLLYWPCLLGLLVAIGASSNS